MAHGTPHWQRDVEERSVISPDGTEIFYEVLGDGRDLLLLANGLGGRLYSWEPLIAGFQPCFAIPGMPRLLQSVSEMALRQPVPLPILRAIALRMKGLYLLGFAAYVGPRALALRPVLHQYLSDVLGPSFENYMVLFQELDAHSVYHLLPEIEAPALVVSGLLDLLTPAR